MDDGWVERMRQHSITLDTPGHFRGGLLPGLAMRLYDEFCKADKFSPLIVEGIALEMMGEADRKFAESLESLPPQWLTEVRDLLHERSSYRGNQQSVRDAIQSGFQR